MLTVHPVDDFEGLSPYLREWRRLVTESAEADLFQSPEWVLSWLEAYWHRDDLSFLFVKEGDRLRGVAPFVRDTSGRLQCPDSLALPVNENGPSGIVHDGDPDPVLDAVVTRLLASGAPLRMVLSSVRGDSSVVDALRQVGGELGCHSVSRDRGKFFVVHLDRNWEDYLATASGRFRHELRRKESRAARAGRLRVRVVSEPDELGEAMDEVLAVEARSWKHARGASISTEPGKRGFYAALVRRLGPRRGMRFYLLYVDDQPVAHIFGIVFKNEYYALTTAYDEALGALSPGSILFARALRDAVEQRYEVFNFLAGEGRWKAQMSNGARHYVDMCVFSDPYSRCGYCWAADGYVKPFVRRRLPRLVAAKNRLFNR